MAKIKLQEMSKAYVMLYEIETKMKQHIDLTLTQNYGSNWPRILCTYKNFENLYFRDVIFYFRKYPPLDEVFSPDEILKLYSLKKVRNQIAHMKIITEEEYALLNECHQFVKNNLHQAFSFARF